MVRGFPQYFISKVAKWQSLSGTEQGLFLQALFLLVGVRCLLKLLPFRIWRSLLLKLTTTPVNPPVNPTKTKERCKQVEISQVIRAVEQSSRFMLGVKCLARAVTTGILLRRYGFAPALQLGVKFEPASGFVAHAWVVCSGNVVIGRLVDLERYNLLPLQEGIFL